MIDVKFDVSSGLAPAIVQSASDGCVLMLGYMNREALDRTLETGRVTFYSRSRKRLWEKGETSGHWLEVVRIRPDCDADSLLVLARPHGPTCHTGRASCFGSESGAAALGGVLARLGEVVRQRDVSRPADSYTASLLAAGRERQAQKVGEEGVEVALAAVADAPDRLAAESADLLYHLVVLWQAAGLDPSRVAEELTSRSR